MPTSPLEIDDLIAIESALQVTFIERDLLTLALTHQSYINEHPDELPVSNERLEFLGDSIVGMIVADRLYVDAPDLPEGDLTVRRSQVVRKETLADAAKSIGLGEWLVMGRGESAGGGADRISNLADSFEAVAGAVFIDQGYEQAYSFVNQWLGPYVDEALRSETQKDPKSLLQEHLQGNGSKPPRYRLVSESGSPSDTVFTMEVVIDEQAVASGMGSRKIDAEREAAARALNILETNSNE
ncbi:MAG: ribonuclease III [Chloroflexi bacterium]|nr:ribonuclease III [Chloroflexota bacterium]MBT5253054.1 ribonuclease III [Chloroflexota bacterium]MBT5476157.1 ribonuclease III [Chloroflexota bacterium]MBT5892256.1 ribonuclease III [Chloroflexota bacterium]